MRRRLLDSAIISIAIVVAGVVVYGYALYLVVRGPVSPGRVPVRVRPGASEGAPVGEMDQPPGRFN